MARSEAVKAWGMTYSGELQPLAERNGPTPKDLLPRNAISVPVVVMHASDYRKLLRAAKRKRA